MSEQLKLNWGGQNCHIMVYKRPDSVVRRGSCDKVFATFHGTPGYGGPSLELCEVRNLLARMEAMAEASAPQGVKR